MVPRQRDFFLLFLAAAFLSGAVKTQDELTRLCSAQERCRDCILASPMCNWCADETFNGTARCYVVGTIDACSPENTQDPRGEEGGSEGESFESFNQISPRRLNATVRPGEALTFQISVQPANNFPLDLYLLMDLSFSMRDDLENLQSLGALLAQRITGISSNSTIGFGSFVDKRLAPYINLDPARLVDPCLDGCVSPYSYRHVISLTNNTELFNMSVQDQVISGNQDSPEGGFDGFLQAIVCRNMIGWRDPSRKLLLYISDAGFHFAGDGKLGGVIRPHDGECRMPDVPLSPTDPPVEYEDWDILDYPSIGQIAEKLRENEVIPIFAVEGGVNATFERLVEELNRDWVAFDGTLAADSSNIVNLVEDIYNNISQQVIFQPEQVPGVTIDFIPDGCPGEVVNGVCTGVEVGMTATFTVSISLQECTPEFQNGARPITVQVVGFGSFEILLTAICSCPCEEESVEDSPACSGNGALECGICVSEEEQFGEQCDCDGTQRIMCTHCMIDTAQPIVRVSPLGAENEREYDYFGYSLVLHKLSTALGATVEENMANTRIIVSAPNGTAPSSPVSNTGLVFACPLLPTTAPGGACDPLTGDGGGVDNRLYDTAANTNSEEKSGQFLGASMDSTDDMFIVCAHRYVNINTNNTAERNPFGRCFYSGSSLMGFSEYQPCIGVGERATFSVGVCQTGSSVALAEDTSGNISIGAGAPGTYSWRGILIRRDPSGGDNYEEFGAGADRFSYQGYSMTKGFFIIPNREDFATSVPRRNFYFGTVNLVTNTRSLTVVSQPLDGQQMGEYYGFSVVAVDLNGDGMHELLVGAPLYRDLAVGPETGRVYVYCNTGGSLQLCDTCTLIGTKAYGRFGFAMTNLGDISGDGLDDVAISAPYGNSTDSGTVYIYFGSQLQLITPTPQQVIVGSDLSSSLTIDLSDLRGFGTALASRVDVDGNSYNDLAIGTYESQQVFVLRTRPVAAVRTTLSANPGIISINNTVCRFEQTDLACFNVTVCASYSGLGLGDQLELEFTIFGDRQNREQGIVQEQRLFFDSSRNPNITITETLDITDTGTDTILTCFDTTAYIENDINDIFNGFTVELEVEPAQELVVDAQDGNQSPVDFSPFPVLSLSGSTLGQVVIQTECGSQTCFPDLQVTAPSGTITYETIVSEELATQLTAGLVSAFTIPIEIQNNGDSAFLAMFSFTIPSRMLDYSVPQNCITETLGTTQTRYNCTISRQFDNGETESFDIRLIPQIGLRGNEGTISITFSATSLNPENETALGDNSATVDITVDARADVFLEPAGIVVPELIFYTPIATEGEIVNVAQLGPDVTTTFIVRNSGPTTVPTVVLTIFWPLNASLSTYLLYPFNILAMGGQTVECENTFINPEALLGEDIDEADGEPVTTTEGGRRRKRRKRSLVPKLAMRQSNETIVVDEIMERMLSCIDGGSRDGFTCVPIVCFIRQLPRNGRVELSVVAYLDERYFAGQVNSYTFVPYATVAIQEDYIVQPDSNNSVTATAEIRVSGSSGEMASSTILQPSPTFAPVLTPSPSLGDDSQSITVLYVTVGAVGGLVAAMSILALIAVIIVRVKRKRGISTFQMTGNEAYGTAVHNIAVSENEAYSAVNEHRDEITTSQNEAYGTAVHNAIAVSENEAYSAVNEHRDEITTSQNEAYGTAVHNAIAVSENEAYSAVNECRDEITTSQNEAYGTAVHNAIAVSENEAYSTIDECRDEITTSQNEAYGAVATDQPPDEYEYI